MIRIGLTGPIGCGKSAVAGWLAERGAVAIDADDIAREVTAPGQPAHDAILSLFGDGVRATDATLDRAALGRVVFRDPVYLAQLEAIVHPVVRPRIVERIEAATTEGAPAVVIEGRPAHRGPARAGRAAPPICQSRHRHVRPDRRCPRARGGRLGRGDRLTLAFDPRSTGDAQLTSLRMYVPR
jgi:hypothetical protein